jgi:non-ribosomal peptide synthetase component E (peptide arylation enzyme)
MPSHIANISDNAASHKLSAVVTFRARELVVPKGIDGGEMLIWASADELLQCTLPDDPPERIVETCGRACAGYEIRIWCQDDPDTEAVPGTCEQSQTFER